MFTQKEPTRPHSVIFAALNVQWLRRQDGVNSKLKGYVDALLTVMIYLKLRSHCRDSVPKSMECKQPAGVPPAKSSLAFWGACPTGMWRRTYFAFFSALPSWCSVQIQILARLGSHTR